MRKGLIALSLLFCVCLVYPVQAASEQPVDLTTFDDMLGDALGIGAFGGGLLASLLLLFIVLGCIGIVSKRRPSDFMILVVSLAVFSFSIAATWWPVWSLVAFILLVSLLFGRKVIEGVR